MKGGLGPFGANDRLLNPELIPQGICLGGRLGHLELWELVDLKRNGGNPPRVRQGFVSQQFVRCPDCEDREALRNDGGAKVIGGRQLKGATVDVGVTTAAAGCQSCKGKGRIDANDVEALLKAGIVDPRLADKDPYSYGIKPSAALLRRRTNP